MKSNFSGGSRRGDEGLNSFEHKVSPGTYCTRLDSSL